MSRPSLPWFRKSKNAWYCTLAGRKVSLGVKGEANEKQAVKAWHRLMSGLPLDAATPTAISPETPTPKATQAVKMQAVIDGFLADAKERLSPEGYRKYWHCLTPFGKCFGLRDADALTPAEAEAYARKPEWSSSYRNGILGAIVTAFRWAERSRLIASIPMHGLRKPPKASRGAKTLISLETHERLCKAAKPTLRACQQKFDTPPPSNI